MDTLADAAATSGSPNRDTPGAETPMSPRVPYGLTNDVKLFEVSLISLKNDIEVEQAAVEKLEAEIAQPDLPPQRKRNLTSQKSRHRSKITALHSQLGYATECHRRRMLELHVHQMDLRLWELDFLLQRAMAENRALKAGEKPPEHVPMPSMTAGQPPPPAPMSPYAFPSTGLTPRFAQQMGGMHNAPLSSPSSAGLHQQVGVTATNTS